MANSYFELLPLIDAKDEVLATLIPPAASKRRLRDLLDELKKGVTSLLKAFQGTDANLLPATSSSTDPSPRSPCWTAIWVRLCQLRVIGTINDIILFVLYCSSGAEIIYNSDFETGCVRVLNGQAKRLTRAGALLSGSFSRQGCTRREG